MTPIWRTVRIFISSTFRDMYAERDYLVRFVFPELRERCAQRQLHLVDIDLRWGVTEEEAKQRKALQICLDEIDRCRPFFIGILGEHYGQVLRRYDVPNESRYEWVRQLEPGYSIMAMEIYHGALRDSILKSHQLLENDASIQPPELGKHAISRWLKQLATPSKTTNLANSLPNSAITNQRVFFYFRNPAFLSSVPEEYRAIFLEDDEEAGARLRRLKKAISQYYPVFKDYPCTYAGIGENGKVKLTGLEVFGQRLLEDLWSAISQEYPEKESPFDDLAIERAYHETFIERLSQHFIGREELLQQLSTYANNEGTMAPLVVVGAPGSGKSALLANFVREYRTAHSEIFVLSHFIGVSPGSTDIRLTLLRLCRELARRFRITNEIPSDYQTLREVFPQFLKRATTHIKVFLVLDALNQLDRSYNAYSLEWLPRQLPTGLRLVVSTTVGDCLDTLHRRPIAVEIVLDPLTIEDRREVIQQVLSDYRKRLDERPGHNQIALLLHKKEAGNPLYLKVACEELRVFGGHTRLTEKIMNLADDVPALFQQVLERLENDHEKELVRSALSLLLCSRDGLLESELLELLRREGEEEFPRILWIQLYRSLQFYLRPPGEAGKGMLNFFHEQMAWAVQQRYLEIPREEKAGHLRLAEYFQCKADPTNDKTWKGNYSHALRDLPYHLLEADQPEAYIQLLSSPGFLDRKVRTFSIHDLLLDDTMLLDSNYGMGAELVWDMFNLLRRSTRMFSTAPGAVLPTLYRMICCTPRTLAGDITRELAAFKEMLEAELSRRPWLQALNSSTIHPQLSPSSIEIVQFDCQREVLIAMNNEGDAFDIDLKTFALSPRVAVGERPVAVSQGGLCLTQAHGKLHVWDLSSGELLTELPDEAESGGFLQSDHVAFTWLSHRFVRFEHYQSYHTSVFEFKLWQLDGRQLLSSWDIHGPESGEISAVVVDGERKFALLGTKKGMILKIPLTLPLDEDVLRISEASITSLTVEPQGEDVVIGNEQGEVWIYRLDSGTAKKLIDLDGVSVTALAWLPEQRAFCLATKNGRVAVVSPLDGRVFWQAALADGTTRGLRVVSEKGLIAVWHEFGIDALDIDTGNSKGNVQISTNSTSMKDEDSERLVTRTFFHPKGRVGVFCQGSGLRFVADVTQPQSILRSLDNIPVLSVRFLGNQPEFLSCPQSYDFRTSVYVYYWSFLKGEICKFPCSPFYSLATAFGPSPDLCVLASDVINYYHGIKGDTELWNLKSGKMVKSYLCHEWTHETRSIMSMSTNSNGKVGLFFNAYEASRILAVHDGTTRIFSANTHQVVAISYTRDEVRVLVEKTKARISALAIHPDGHLLAYGCNDGSLSIIHTDEGQPYLHLSGHYGDIAGLQFISWQGVPCLVSIAYDQTLRCWDLRGGICIDSVQLDGLPVSVHAWPDGKLAVVLALGEVIVFKQSNK